MGGCTKTPHQALPSSGGSGTQTNRGSSSGNGSRHTSQEWQANHATLLKYLHLVTAPPADHPPALTAVAAASKPGMQTATATAAPAGRIASTVPSAAVGDAGTATEMATGAVRAKRGSRTSPRVSPRTQAPDHPAQVPARALSIQLPVPASSVSPGAALLAFHTQQQQKQQQQQQQHQQRQQQRQHSQAAPVLAAATHTAAVAAAVIERLKLSGGGGAAEGSEQQQQQQRIKALPHPLQGQKQGQQQQQQQPDAALTAVLTSAQHLQQQQQQDAPSLQQQDGSSLSGLSQAAQGASQLQALLLRLRQGSGAGVAPGHSMYTDRLQSGSNTAVANSRIVDALRTQLNREVVFPDQNSNGLNQAFPQPDLHPGPTSGRHARQVRGIGMELTDPRITDPCWLTFRPSGTATLGGRLCPRMSTWAVAAGAGPAVAAVAVVAAGTGAARGGDPRQPSLRQRRLQQRPAAPCVAPWMKRMETLVNYLLASRTAEHPPLSDLTPTSTAAAHTSGSDGGNSQNCGTGRGTQPAKPCPRPVNSSSPGQHDPTNPIPLQNTNNIYAQLLRSQSARSHNSVSAPGAAAAAAAAGGGGSSGGGSGSASPRAALLRNYCDVKHNRPGPTPVMDVQAKPMQRGNCWFAPPPDMPLRADLRSASNTNTLSRWGYSHPALAAATANAEARAAAAVCS
ncbi:MAG: hypothetical protein WDW38_008276 [Sanguina aurantia]